MKIVVAGTGYVGLVTAVCLAEVGNNVTCLDIDEAKVNKMKSGICPIFEPGLQELLIKNYKEGKLDFTTDYKTAYKDADIIFIGVGTPEKSDCSANLNYIYIVAEQIARSIEKDCLVVVKSTVPIGTNGEVEVFIKENLKNSVHIEVASNPEFLSQGTAVKDTLHARRIVIGVESKNAEAMLKQIYDKFNLPIVVTNRKSAEMIKYASNDFLALKLSFINEIANVYELVGADIDDVTLGMSYDPRIGDKFLKAGIGYGGSCFPKDTKALHWLAEVYAYDPIGIDSFKRIHDGKVNYVNDPEVALKDADMAFIFTEWGAIKEIPLSKYKELMNEAIIFDGRNCYSLQESEAAKIEYYSIGRPEVKK